MHRDGDSYHPNVMQEIMQDLLLILQTLLIRLESHIQCTIDVLSALYIDNYLTFSVIITQVKPNQYLKKSRWVDCGTYIMAGRKRRYVIDHASSQTSFRSSSSIYLYI